MKFWKEASRRALPALLALALCFGMLPVAAAGGEAADGTVAVKAGASGVKGIGIGVKKKARAVTAAVGWDVATKAKAKAMMEGMTTEEKVGQLFLLHWPGDGKGGADEARSVIAEYSPGGLIVFDPMFEDGATKDSVRAKIAAAQEASKVPLVISVDEEGGQTASGRRIVRVSSHTNFRAEPFRSPQELKAAGNGSVSEIAAEYKEMAELLKDLGINMDHAPVADTSTSGGYIYGRTWGGTYDENAAYVAAAVEALESNGMGTTLKHFPGYGDSASDTHNGFAVDDRDEATLNNYMAPFKAGIEAGSRAVMVTHNIINVLDTETPVSLLPKAYELLRKDLGFDGLAITDDLGMGAITAFVGSGSPAVSALRAGADMVITADVGEISKAVAAAKAGTLPMDRVDEACARVLCWKVAQGLVAEEAIPTEASYTPAGGTEPAETGAFAGMWQLARENGGTVTLLKDIRVTGPFFVKNDIVLDLGGKSMVAGGSTEPFLFGWDQEAPDGSLTVRDTGGSPDKAVRQLVPYDQVGDAVYSHDTRTLTYYDISDVCGTDESARKNVVDMGGRGSIEMLAGGNWPKMFSMYCGRLDLEGGSLRCEGGPVVYARYQDAPGRERPKVRIDGAALVGSACGIYATWSDVVMDSGYIAGNIAGEGSGIYLYDTGFELNGGVIAGNRSRTLGGGIFAWHSWKTKINGGLVTGNKANFGGGMFLSGCRMGDKMYRQMDNAGICFNHAEKGGGIYMGNNSLWSLDLTEPSYGGWFSVRGGYVMRNTASSAGGGVYLNESDDTGDRTRLVIGGRPVVRDNILVPGDGNRTANNVRIQDGQAVRLYVDDGLEERACVGISGSEGQLVAGLTDLDLSRLHSDDEDLEIVKLDGGVYLMRTGQEYVDVKIHDIRAGAPGKPDEDHVLTVKVPKGWTLSGSSMKLDGHGAAAAAKDCVFYTDAGRSERFDPGTELEGDVELYTYLFVLSFAYEGGRKDVPVREGQAPPADALVVNGADVSGLGFTDEDGGEVAFGSLMDGLDRSYEFCNVVVDDIGSGNDRSHWVLAGLDCSVVLDMVEASRWDVSGAGADQVSREYADEGKTKERVTVRSVVAPVTIGRSAVRETDGTKYALAAIVDGKARVLADLNALRGPGLFDGREYRYMPVGGESGAAAAAALEPFGFDPDLYDGGLVFANTDGDAGSYGSVYAEVRPDEDPAGGWRIPFARSDTGNSFDRCRMFYLSRPLDGVSGEAIGMDGLSGYGFWTVSVRDYANEGKEGDASFERYVAHDGSTSFDLPEADGLEWKAVSGHDASVTMDRGTKPGWVHVEISGVRSRVTLYRGESSSLKYSVQYCAYMDEIDWDGDKNGGVTKLDVIDTSVLEKLPSNDTEPGSEAVRSIWLDNTGKVMTRKDELKMIYRQRDFNYNEAPSLVYCDMNLNYVLEELWIYKGNDRDADLSSMERDESVWTIVTKEMMGGKDLRGMHLTSDPDFAKEHPDDTLLVEDGAIIRFIYDTTEDNTKSTSVDVTFYDYDITDGKLYSDKDCTVPAEAESSSKLYVNTRGQGINGSGNEMSGGGPSQFAFGNGNTGIGDGLINAKLPDGKFFNKANGTATISGCAFGIVQNRLDVDGNVRYADGVQGPRLFGDGEAEGKTVIDGAYSLSFTRVGDNYTLAGVQKKDGGENVTGIGHEYSGDLSRFEAVYDYKPGWSPTRKLIYSNSFWPMDKVYDNGAFGGWDGHDPKFGKTGNIGYLGSDDPLPVSDDSNSPGSPADVYNRAVDHNSYFGMSFDINFSLHPDYIGTLDYCFFGDDDMWVFLDGEQILDIGGVHSSVGEYVDLWDYVKDGDGNLIRDKKDHTEVTEHTLSVFYLERGASGSTCWMRFTLPDARFEEGGKFGSDEFSSLLLTKIAEGGGLDGTEEFSFGVALKDASGAALMDDYRCVLHQAGGVTVEGIFTPRGFRFGKEASAGVKLKSGEQMEIFYVPVGTMYEISEAPDARYEATFKGDGAVQAGNTVSGRVSAGSAVDIVCTNESVQTFEFPKTGGTGTGALMAAGLALVLSAWLALARTKRRG